MGGVGTFICKLAAGGAWLSAIASFCLRDAAEREALSSGTFKLLNRGIAGAALAMLDGGTVRC